MLAGIYYGAQYGGSTTAILVNLPGESSSVVTAIDGNQMARKGKAGLALATAALASFLAGTFATFVIALAAPALAEVALQVRPGRLFLADGVRPRRRGDPRARLGGQGDRHDPGRHAARHGRHRRQHQRAALHLRHPAVRRRHRFRGHRHGHLRHRRDHRQPGAHRRRRAPTCRTIKNLWPTLRDLRAMLRAGLPRHAAGLGARHPAGRRAGAGVVLGLCAGEEDLHAAGALRQGRDRGRGRARRRPTTARRRPPSSRC